MQKSGRNSGWGLAWTLDVSYERAFQFLYEHWCEHPSKIMTSSLASLEVPGHSLVASHRSSQPSLHRLHRPQPAPSAKMGAASLILHRLQSGKGQTYLQKSNNDCLQPSALCRSCWEIKVRCLDLLSYLDGLAVMLSFGVSVTRSCLKFHKSFLFLSRKFHGNEARFGLPNPPIISELITEEDAEEARTWATQFVNNKVPKEAVDFSFSRSSGPGGQVLGCI